MSETNTDADLALIKERLDREYTGYVHFIRACQCTSGIKGYLRMLVHVDSALHTDHGVSLRRAVAMIDELQIHDELREDHRLTDPDE